MQLDNITNAFFFPSCLLLGTRFLNTGSQNHSVRVGFYFAAVVTMVLLACEGLPRFCTADVA